MIANKYINNPGLSIVALSLAMNFLVLPLYKRADAMQEEEQEIEKKLEAGIKHIKKTFKGDEKMMMLQTYYRQNNYKPTYVFRSSISLFLEIPFFIAAYQFLSHLTLLNGVAFGFVKNLGAADSIIKLGNVSINVLPFVMTGINLISCSIFTKGSTLKSKIKLYAMAIFFLIFLYDSPAGLVIYWTLNNLFSLFKTIYYKLRKPQNSIIANTDDIKELKSNPKTFYFAAIFMTLLLGTVIPSSVIKSSPQEFVDLFYYMNPIWYICSSLCLAAGTFMVWMNVFYGLTKPVKRHFFELGVFSACLIFVADYMLFNKKFGNLGRTLKYEFEFDIRFASQIKNLVVIFAVVLVAIVIYKFFSKYVYQALLVASVAFIVMTAVNLRDINKDLSMLKASYSKADENKPSFKLSKNGKNVVVIMLDRAMGEYIPYIMQEKPELKKVYSGFTYYSNVVSFGGYTLCGAPPLFGGYEYTPTEINARKNQTMVEKHNEALKVMPAIFYENGYDVTVCDPSYAGYQWIPDLSIYDEYPDMNTYHALGSFNDSEVRKIVIENNKRNFFCYSVMKVVPLFIQGTIYDGGNYNHSVELINSHAQIVYEDKKSVGVEIDAMESYQELENLSNMTEITEDSENTFLMMCNDITHAPIMYQTPNYTLSQYVDNTKYDPGKYVIDGVTLNMDSLYQYVHYQANMAAYLRIGEWIEYLKENGVYDNTRIILVSDHGRYVYQLENMILDEGKYVLEADEPILQDGMGYVYDLECYYPLLMVKDFDSDGFSTDEEFMTNADVPVLAFKDIIASPVNPFTGNLITNDEKYAHDQIIMGKADQDGVYSESIELYSDVWFSVHDDMRITDNWTEIGE